MKGANANTNAKELQKTKAHIIVEIIEYVPNAVLKFGKTHKVNEAMNKQYKSKKKFKH